MFPPKFSDDDGDGSYADDSIVVLSAVVKNEINKAGTLEMDLLYNGNELIKPYFDFICAYDYDADSKTRDILFFGRAISVEYSPDGITHVLCEGYMACLNDAPMFGDHAYKPFTLGAEDYLVVMFINAIEAYHAVTERYEILAGSKGTKWNLQGTYYEGDVIPFSRAKYYVKSEVDISPGTSVGSFILDELVGNYGGVVYVQYGKYSIPFGKQVLHLMWTDEPDTTASGYPTSDEGINFEANLLDASYETSNDNIFTAVMPWFDHIQPEKGESWIEQRSSGISYPAIYQNDKMVQKYGLIVVSKSFSGCKTGAQLKRKAENWLKTNCKDYGSIYTFKMIDLHYLDPYDKDGLDNQDKKMKNNRAYTKRIHIMDKVAVTYPPYMKHLDTANVRKRMICLTATYDLLHPENDEITIGAVVPPDLSGIKNLSKNKK